MNKIIRPRTVALDSSHLGAIARDKFSNNAIHRERAVAFERAWEASSSLLLCWHHIEELLSYHDKEVVERRIAFLRILPVVAVIRAFADDDIIGSVINLQANEAAIAFKEPKASVTAIRDEVAKSIFRFESGTDVISPLWRGGQYCKPSS
jgi:hypothetical protein